MKEIAAVALAAAFVFFTLIATDKYFSPYLSCVRAQVADKQHPMTEAEAHLECGRWIREK